VLNGSCWPSHKSDLSSTKRRDWGKNEAQALFSFHSGLIWNNESDTRALKIPQTSNHCFLLSSNFLCCIKITSIVRLLSEWQTMTSGRNNLIPPIKVNFGFCTSNLVEIYVLWVTMKQLTLSIIIECHKITEKTSTIEGISWVKRD
jgi:hypothetical protein